MSKREASTPLSEKKPTQSNPKFIEKLFKNFERLPNDQTPAKREGRLKNKTKVNFNLYPFLCLEQCWNDLLKEKRARLLNEVEQKKDKQEDKEKAKKIDTRLHNEFSLRVIILKQGKGIQIRFAEEGTSDSSSTIPRHKEMSVNHASEIIRSKKDSKPVMYKPVMFAGKVYFDLHEGKPVIIKVDANTGGYKARYFERITWLLGLLVFCEAPLASEIIIKDLYISKESATIEKSELISRVDQSKKLLESKENILQYNVDDNALKTPIHIEGAIQAPNRGVKSRLKLNFAENNSANKPSASARLSAPRLPSATSTSSSNIPRKPRRVRKRTSPSSGYRIQSPHKRFSPTRSLQPTQAEYTGARKFYSDEETPILHSVPSSSSSSIKNELSKNQHSLWKTQKPKNDNSSSEIEDSLSSLLPEF